MIKKLQLFLLLVFFSFTSFAFKGQYEGAIIANGNKLRLIAEFAETKTKTVGSLYSIDQSDAKIPLTEISINKETITLSAGVIGVNITGKLSKSAIKGTFKQGGFSQKITLKKSKK